MLYALAVAVAAAEDSDDDSAHDPNQSLVQKPKPDGSRQEIEPSSRGRSLSWWSYDEESKSSSSFLSSSNDCHQQKRKNERSSIL